MCDPKKGFKLKTPQETLMWWRFMCFEKGICPRDARKTYMKDIREILEIKNAISEKQIRQQQIEKMMNNIRG
ncbi:hypothetical protein GQ473_01140 [archaeon]|nr:hypothetical protein [archaeon]